MMCEYFSIKMVASVLSYMGDFQLRAFISFMRNHIEWHLAMKSDETNEERAAFGLGKNQESLLS